MNFAYELRRAKAEYELRKEQERRRSEENENILDKAAEKLAKAEFKAKVMPVCRRVANKGEGSLFLNRLSIGEDTLPRANLSESDNITLLSTLGYQHLIGYYKYLWIECESAGLNVIITYNHDGSGFKDLYDFTVHW